MATAAYNSLDLGEPATTKNIMTGGLMDSVGDKTTKNVQ
jgi:hypothetical protein